MDARPVALVTGAAQGIGLETARRLSATHRVALLDLRAERLQEARRSCAGDPLAVVCDIAEQDQVTAAVAEVIERAGGIDVAVSNAGIGAGGALRHLDPEVLEAIIDVNLIGNRRVTHACLPSIVAGRGHVLANASASALLPATPRVDAATAERVARLGDFDAAFRPRSSAHRAAGHHVHHDLHDAPAP
jgi:NAD(P)-dependent dehydrogenase (short-subunit alcohol dehydrogenase family)